MSERVYSVPVLGGLLARWHDSDRGHLWFRLLLDPGEAGRRAYLLRGAAELAHYGIKPRWVERLAVRLWGDESLRSAARGL